MKRITTIASALGIGLLAATPFLAAADTSALSVTCSGVPTDTSVTWSATSSGGVSPVALSWGNGATSTTQTLSYSPGTYTMTVQATDASSTVATSSCSATVAAASSGSTDSLIAKIQALLAQIAALKQQVLALVQQSGTTISGSTVASSTISGCPMPNRDLSEGDSGDDVKNLQQFLAQNEPTLFSSDHATGFFGPLTRNAMEHFQEDHGIVASSTGFVGPVTRAFFGMHCGEVEGEGHLRGISNSWMDASSTMQVSDSNQGGGDQGNQGDSGQGDGQGDGSHGNHGHDN